jgi:predicted aldo/keto reductase-like oxidoreductase
MRYRRFGRTNVQIPVFSCGGMRYQHKWEDVKPEDIPAANQANLEATIHRSLELGINHIETARGYGTSEMQLGWLLPKLPREKMLIQTKVAPFANPQEFIDTFEKSMDYLKLDYVDFFSIHGINLAEHLDWTLAKGGCLEIARRFQREGRVRFIGFSTHAPECVITRGINTGEFDYVNLHWYYVNHLNEASIQAATKHDMGMFIISPNDKGGKLYSPPPKLVDLTAPLSPMAFNDLYCLARPDVHTLSLGASKPSDFDEHVRALEHYDRAAEVTAPIVAKLDAAVSAEFGPEWLARWDEHLPEYYNFPNDVNVQEITRLYTYAKALDLVDWGQMRYNLLGNAGHWFPGEHLGKLNGADLAPALAKSPFRDQILDLLPKAHALLHAAEVKRLSQSD